jgi:hypothetical protein
MKDEFKNVTITPALAKVLGKPSPTPRFFHADGDDEAFTRWWDALVREFPRGLVSPGGACPYAGVSRAAVHKAMKDGRLTVFAFHPVKEQRGIFGSKLVRTNPYLYLPVVELKAWRVELEERIGRWDVSEAEFEKVLDKLAKELEGGEPDWEALWTDEHPDGRVVKKKGKAR